MGPFLHCILKELTLLIGSFLPFWLLFPWVVFFLSVCPPSSPCPFRFALQWKTTESGRSNSSPFYPFPSCLSDYCFQSVLWFICLRQAFIEFVEQYVPWICFFHHGHVLLHSSFARWLGEDDLLTVPWPLPYRWDYVALCMQHSPSNK